ncbi:MAG TPA: response regulator transcription factor [Alphaproteobacteria bacterium]|nr:response regulator transcription factor [Alphaproteobacteria bacterium]
MARIIVVEDEVDLRSDLVEYLAECGFDAVGAADGRELDGALAAGGADIVLLDVNLPGEDGFKIAARLRQTSRTGIVMLTARSSSVDRVIGLELGADAYLVKPVDFRELEAQIRALLRRLSMEAPVRPAPEPPPPPSAAGWSFDSVGWRLTTPGGVAVTLTAAEFRFLSLLVAQPGEPVSRREIAKMLDSRDWTAGSRSIDSLVRRLRTKVESHGAALPVQAVHGIGYVFTAPVTAR